MGYLKKVQLLSYTVLLSWLFKVLSTQNISNEVRVSVISSVTFIFTNMHFHQKIFFFIRVFW